MPTNYENLLFAENELSSDFFESLDNLFKIHKNLWKYIFDLKLTTENLKKINYKIAFLCDKSILAHKNILDDCVWIISKDQPRANHLRYIISLIYSIKDMDALVKYPIKILSNINTEIKITNEIKKLVNSYLSTFDKMIKLLKEKKVENTYEKSKILKEKFLISYESFIDKNFKNDKNNSLEIYKIIKSLDKTIDHLFNLFDNFRFIKNKSKKTNKINLKNIL